MRITAIAPSMPRPTYALSSAPQGPVGATTPVARLVAPAATETQRSGWQLPTVRQFSRFARCAGLVPLLLLAACGEENASKLANSLVRKANVGEVASVFRRANFPSSICPLPYSRESTIQGFSHFVTGENTDLPRQTGLTAIERFDCAREMAVLKNPDPSKSSAQQFVDTGLPELVKSPNPEVRSTGSILTGNGASMGDSSGGGACDLPGLKPWVSKAEATVERHGNNPNLSPKEESDLDKAKSGLYWNTYVLPVFNEFAAAVPEACGLARDAVAGLGPVNRPNAERAVVQAYSIFGPTPNRPRWENGLRQNLVITSPVTQ
jgi:hypothetical protein